jgi:hypothetical protein
MSKNSNWQSRGRHRSAKSLVQHRRLTLAVSRSPVGNEAAHGRQRENLCENVTDQLSSQSSIQKKRYRPRYISFVVVEVSGSLLNIPMTKLRIPSRWRSDRAPKLTNRRTTVKYPDGHSVPKRPLTRQRGNAKNYPPGRFSNLVLLSTIIILNNFSWVSRDIPRVGLEQSYIFARQAGWLPPIIERWWSDSDKVSKRDSMPLKSGELHTWQATNFAVSAPCILS